MPPFWLDQPRRHIRGDATLAANARLGTPADLLRIMGYEQRIIPLDAGAAEAAEALREWLRYETWSLREGLLILAGIDPHRSDRIKFNDDCTAVEITLPEGETVGMPTWCRLGSPPRVEIGQDGLPRIVGPMFCMEDVRLLNRLMEHWHRAPAHSGLTRAAPAHFIAWAERIGEAPCWLGAVRRAGYIPSAQPAPSASVGAAPAVKASSAGAGAVRRTWRDVAGQYMAETLRAGRFGTAKELEAALRKDAGKPESPFDLGTGQHRGNLMVRDVGKPLTLKTVQNNWTELRKAAGLA